MHTWWSGQRPAHCVGCPGCLEALLTSPTPLFTWPDDDHSQTLTFSFRRGSGLEAQIWGSWAYRQFVKPWSWTSAGNPLKRRGPKSELKRWLGTRSKGRERNAREGRRRPRGVMGSHPGRTTTENLLTRCDARFEGPKVHSTRHAESNAVLTSFCYTIF